MTIYSILAIIYLLIGSLITIPYVDETSGLIETLIIIWSWPIIAILCLKELIMPTEDE